MMVVEIVIPNWFGAALLCAGMILGIISIIAGVLAELTGKNGLPLIFIGVGLLFCFDAITVIASSTYITTPINGVASIYDATKCYNATGGYKTIQCIYPTVNPYEQQPLHPIKWMLDNAIQTLDAINGALKIKLQPAV